jgi:hemolysin-activating ACP:hemolysin acyltransferase
MLEAETPDFINPQQWPPNSPDLNPVDYAIWGILQERVYRCQIRDVDHLKERWWKSGVALIKALLTGQ